MRGEFGGVRGGAGLTDLHPCFPAFVVFVTAAKCNLDTFLGSYLHCCGTDEYTVVSSL